MQDGHYTPKACCYATEDVLDISPETKFDDVLNEVPIMKFKPNNSLKSVLWGNLER